MAGFPRLQSSHWGQRGKVRVYCEAENGGGVERYFCQSKHKTLDIAIHRGATSNILYLL